MPKSALNTIDPVALRYLMTEPVFDVGEQVHEDAARAPAAAAAAAEPEQVKKPEPAAPSFTFLGRNNRNYLFLTDEQQADWMAEPAMDAFVKTLAALKLTVDDVAVLNLAKLAAAPQAGQLVSFFKPRVVVNLGTPFSWPEQPGVKLLDTYSFNEMLADAGKKRTFWTAIKTLLT